MERGLRRRCVRALEGDADFGDLTNLLLIDGGQEHTRVALRVLQELSLDIPAFSMVKDERHRTRALMTADGREI